MSRNRIVLDTNSLVQCIAPRSRYRRIWDSYVEGDYVLCVSNEILNEYEEILERLAGVEVSKYAIEAILNSSNTLFCVPSYNFHLIEADSCTTISLWIVLLPQARLVSLRRIIIFLY